MADKSNIDVIANRLLEVIEQKLEPNGEILSQYVQLDKLITLDSGDVLRSLLNFQSHNQDLINTTLDAVGLQRFVGDTLQSALMITDVGTAKIQAGSANSITIDKIAVGDGNGNAITIDTSATALTNQVWEGNVSDPSQIDGHPYYLFFDAFIPATVGGFTVREVALFDSDGDMFAIGATSAVAKEDPNETVGSRLALRVVIEVGQSEYAAYFNKRSEEVPKYAEWSTLSGNVKSGTIVGHNSQTWVLKNDLVSVEASEPNYFSNDWVLIESMFKRASEITGVPRSLISLADTTSSLNAEVIIDLSNELTLIAYSELLKPYVISSISRNNFGGFTVSTDRGEFEFVTPDIMNLRNGGNGWATKILKETNTKGWGHDKTNLPAVIALITTQAQNSGQRVMVSVDSDTVASQQLVWNTDYVSIDFCDSVLDSSSVDGAAVLVTSSLPSKVYANAMMKFCNAEIKGSRTSGRIGMYFNTDVGGTSTRCGIDNVVIHDFDIGHSFGAHSYAVKNDLVSIYSCNKAISDLGGTDSGENISYTKCMIFNNTLAVEAKNPNGSIQLYNSHIDYNGKQFDIQSSNVMVNGGHIEDTNPARRITITGNGASLFISNAEVLRGSSSSLTDYYASVDDGCSLVYRDCFLNNMARGNTEFYTGEGNCLLDGINYLNIHGMSKILSKGSTLVQYPTFESLSNECFLRHTDGTLTDLHTSDIGNLTTDGTELNIVKTGASSGANMTVYLSCPIPMGSLVGCLMEYDASELTADVYVTPRYAKLGRTLDGFITAERVEDFDGSKTIEAGATGVVTVAGFKYRAPNWATHLIYQFNLFTLISNQNLKIKGFYVSKMG